MDSKFIQILEELTSKIAKQEEVIQSLVTQNTQILAQQEQLLSQTQEQSKKLLTIEQTIKQITINNLREWLAELTSHINAIYDKFNQKQEILQELSKLEQSSNSSDDITIDTDELEMLTNEIEDRNKQLYRLLDSVNPTEIEALLKQTDMSTTSKDEIIKELEEIKKGLEVTNENVVTTNKNVLKNFNTMVVADKNLKFVNDRIQDYFLTLSDKLDREYKEIEDINKQTYHTSQVIDYLPRR